MVKLLNIKLIEKKKPNFAVTVKPKTGKKERLFLFNRAQSERSENHRSTAWLLLKIHFDKCCVPWVTLHGTIK